MIKPSLLALLAPGMVAARKPGAILMAGMNSDFEQFVQAAASDTEEPETAAATAEMDSGASIFSQGIPKTVKVSILSLIENQQAGLEFWVPVNGSSDPVSGEQADVGLPLVKLPSNFMTPSAAGQWAATEPTRADVPPVTRPETVVPASEQPSALALHAKLPADEPSDALVSEVAEQPRPTLRDFSVSEPVSGRPEQFGAPAQPTLGVPRALEKMTFENGPAFTPSVSTRDAAPAMTKADWPTSFASPLLAALSGMQAVSPTPFVQPMPQPDTTDTVTAVPPSGDLASDLRPNPFVAASGPMPSPLIPGEPEVRPKDGHRAPPPDATTDHLHGTKQATGMPVANAGFRLPLAVTDSVAQGTVPAGAAPLSDQAAGTTKSPGAELASATDWLTGQEATSAPITPLSTPNSTPADASVPLIDPAIDLAAAEVQRAAQTSGDPVRTAHSFAEHAPRVIETIAQAARALVDRPVELVLNPEELGRLRMTLLSSDGGMVVQVTVERPETLELLRRHIELLANDLRQAGYERVTCCFAGDREAGGQPDPRHASGSESTDRQETQPATAPEHLPDTLSLTLAGDGLDLRL